MRLPVTVRRATRKPGKIERIFGPPRSLWVPQNGPR